MFKQRLHQETTRVTPVNINLRDRTIARWNACLSAGVFSGSQILTVALYAVLAEKLQISLSGLIASFALGSFLFIFGGPYWSSRSDRWGRGLPLTVGLLALCISFGIVVGVARNPFAQAHLNLLTLIASRVVYGLIASAVLPIAQSIHSDHANSHDPASVTRSMTLHSMSIQLGRVAALALVLTLSDDFQRVLFLQLGLIFVTFLFSLYMPKGPVWIAHSPVLTLSWISVAVHARGPLLLAFLFTSFVEILNSTLAGTLQRLFGLDARQTSRMTAKYLLISCLGIVAVQILLRAFPQIQKTRGLISGAVALALGSLILLQTSSVSEFSVAIVLCVLGFGLLPPIYQALLREKISAKNFSLAAGLVSSVHTLGFASGGAIAALAIQFAGHANAPLLGLALTITAVCFMLPRLESLPRKEGVQ